MIGRLTRWGAPATYVGAVVVIGLTLITVLVRAPDTKANYQHDGADYARTALSVIGEDGAFGGFGGARGTDAGALYVGAGCASCHGLDGEGGVVGPAIWRSDATELLEAVRANDRPGMPHFADAQLSDDQVAAIADFLVDRLQASNESDGDAAAAGEADARASR